MRFVALAEWNGGRIAREAKALVPSAIHWVHGEDSPPDILCGPIISSAVRCPDPFFQVRSKWIVRRLSPSCSRIELETMNSKGQELKLLRAMGWETANIHLGTKAAIKNVRVHLNRQEPGWLCKAAKKMVNGVAADWQQWREAAEK